MYSGDVVCEYWKYNLKVTLWKKISGQLCIEYILKNYIDKWEKSQNSTVYYTWNLTRKVVLLFKNISQKFEASNPLFFFGN